MTRRAGLRRVALGAAAVLAVQGTALSPRETQLVRYWLTCIDCGATLDSIGAIGSRKPSASVDTLNTALVTGPAQPRLSAVDSVLVLAYVRDSSYRVTQGMPPLALSRVQYVVAGHGRFVEGYRARGAYGLGRIHSVPAVAALDAALGTVLPPSVRRAVIFARDSMP